MASESRISLMFSGGVDSTSAAALLAREYDVVHLLTFGNGYGHTRIDRSEARAEELRRHYGDRFTHTIDSVRSLFERILPDPTADFERYGSGFVWCMGCKLAMHTRSVLHNLEHGVPDIADGSSGSTGEMVEQMPLSMRLVREFYAEYGIRYRTPVYDIPRDDEIAMLETEGFRMGVRVQDRFLGIQPMCTPGVLYYLPFLTLKQPPKHDEEAVQAFIEDKLHIARAHIAEVCRERGLPATVPGAKTVPVDVPDNAPPSSAPISRMEYVKGTALVAGAHAGQLGLLLAAALVKPHYRRVVPFHVEFTKRTLGGILRRDRIQVGAGRSSGERR